MADATVVLTASKDAIIEEGDPDDNTNSAGQLTMGDEAGKAVRSVITFDLSTVPAGATVTKATLKFKNETQSPSPTGRTFRGTTASMDDVKLREAFPNTTHETGQLFIADQDDGNLQRSILKIPLTGLFDNGKNVTAATLTIHGTSHGGSGTAEGKQIDMLKLTQQGWVEAEATWNDYKSATAWTTAGGDTTTTPTPPTTTVPASPGDMSFDALQHTLDADDQGDELDVLIKFNDETKAAADANSVRFLDSGTGASNERPKLIVVYDKVVKTLEIRAITQEWVEAEVTWNEYSSGNSWATAGGDFGAGAAQYSQKAVEGAAVEIDVTSLITWESATLADFLVKFADETAVAPGDDLTVLVDSIDFPIVGEPELVLAFTPVPGQMWVETTNLHYIGEDALEHIVKYEGETKEF